MNEPLEKRRKLLEKSLAAVRTIIDIVVGLVEVLEIVATHQIILACVCVVYVFVCVCCVCFPVGMRACV